jgi:3-dehydroquinate synthase
VNDLMLEVRAFQRQYQVAVGMSQLTSRALYERLRNRHVVAITHTHLAEPYLLALEQNAGARRWQSIHVAPGEASKSISQAEAIFEQLAEWQCGRDVLLLALGGGVIGDLTGFVAASYMRGVDFIQVPTTLLAMVDSSVGGKTAVNLKAGKNLVGAFWQPIHVSIDPLTLNTLPKRELSAGLAEVIKYGAIIDAEFFGWLEQHHRQILALEPEALMHAIATSVRIKAEIVARDEFERAERALLNFGHTFGHALEAEAQFSGYLHGEAVAVGMVKAAQLSERLGLAVSVDRERLEHLLLACGLPTREQQHFAPERLAARMLGDKKNLKGEVRCILWNGIGRARLPEPVPLALLEEVWRSAR